MIGRTISHYRIVEKLGEGGMGVVYIAEDTLLGRRVAIKTLTTARGPVNQHFRMRFLREAQAVSKLSHPHIATIYDYGETEDGEPYIVMELVEGETLATLISTEALTIPRALEIVGQVAEALGEAHRRGIVHRDIKPSNIAINERGTVKVLDFGLAKEIAPASVIGSDPAAQAQLKTQTREGVIVGTPMYLSPEQALGVEVDARSDLFSLGSVLYECIAGRPAFAGKSDIDICANVIRDDPPRPSEFNPSIPAELDRLTLKALAKKPEARYQTADELISDLDTAQTQARGLTQTVTRMIEAPPGTRSTSALATLSDIIRRPRLSIGYVATVTVIIGLLASGAYLLWVRAKPHKPTPEAQRLYDLGVAALREGSYYKASKILKDSIQQDGKFGLAYARMAEALVELDFHDRAKEAVLQASALANSRSSKLSSQDSLYLQSINAIVLHDFAQAIEDYKLLAQQVPRENRSSAFLDLGRVYEKNEDFEGAAKSYLEVTKEAPEYAAALLRLGVLNGRQQDVQKALGYFDQCERLFKEQGNHEGITEVYYQRGSLLNDLNRTSEAKSDLQQSLDLARNTTYNQYQEIRILLQLSSVSTTEGNLEQAKALATQATEAAVSNDMASLKTQGLIEIGNAFFAGREYVDAARYFKQAIESAESYKGLSNGARARLSLGSLYIQQEENIDEGLRLVEDAFAFYQKGGYARALWQAMLLRARAKLQRGNYDAARQALDDLLQYAQKSGDPLLVADTHFESGVLLANQELYPQALQHFIESRNRYETLGNPMKKGYAWLYSGDMFWRLGRYSEADQALDHATSLAGQIKSLSIRIGLTKTQEALSRRDFKLAMISGKQVLGLIGTGYRRTAIELKYTVGSALVQSGMKRGLKDCQEAVDLAVTYRDPHLLSNALLALAEAKLLNGDATGALQLARQATDRFDQASQLESSWRANILAGRAAQSSNDYESARVHMLHATDLLSSLKQKFGEASYKDYITRSDIRFYLGQLEQAPDIAR